MTDAAANGDGVFMYVCCVGISTVRLVETLQLCCLSLSHSNRQRLFTFIDFLSHASSNSHLAATCQKLTRPQVHSPLLSGLPSHPD